MAIFSDYEPLADISDRLAIPSLVFCIVTPLVVFARFLARTLYRNILGADDWTILASLVFALAVNIQMIICCQWGFGKHTDKLSLPIVSRTLELYFYAQILYKLTIGLTKISILILYLRVFNVIRWFKIACWTVGSIVFSFTVASVVASIFQCTPVRFAYDKMGTNGTCINLTKFWYGNAGYNIGTDLLIITLPLFVIHSLKIPRRNRVALGAIFSLGILYVFFHFSRVFAFTSFFNFVAPERIFVNIRPSVSSVCITSVLRFTTLNISTVRTDSMWQSIDSSMWTVIEFNLAILVACMPAFRSPIAHAFPFLVGRGRKTTDPPSFSDRSRSNIIRGNTKNSDKSMHHATLDRNESRSQQSPVLCKGKTLTDTDVEADAFDGRDNSYHQFSSNSGRPQAMNPRGIEKQSEGYGMQDLKPHSRDSDVTTLNKSFDHHTDQWPLA